MCKGFCIAKRSSLFLLIAILFVFVGSSSKSKGAPLPAKLTSDDYENILDMANLSGRIYGPTWTSFLDIRAPFVFNQVDFSEQTENFIDVADNSDSLEFISSEDRSIIVSLINKYTKGDDGLHARVYLNTEDPNQMVLVFRGTDFMNLPDWYTNIKQLLNYSIDSVGPQQYAKSIWLAEELKEYAEANNYLLEVAGHSLGGALTQVVGMSTGLKATAFNSNGLRKTTLVELGIIPSVEKQVPGELIKTITLVNVHFCPVADLNGKMDRHAPVSSALQYGSRVFWLKNLFMSGRLLNPNRGLNHFHHAVVLQLERKAFIRDN